MRDYKKELVLFVLALGIFFCAVIGITNPFSRGTKASTEPKVEETVSTAEEVETENSAEEAIKVSPLSEERVSENKFLSQEENLPFFDGSEIAVEYQVDDFKINRFDSFISIKPEKEGTTSYNLSGSDFIITQNDIWFINDNREVTSFNYRNFEYTARSYEIEPSEVCVTYGYADIDKEKEVTWAKYQNSVTADGKSVAFTCGYGYDGTLLFENNMVSLLSREIPKDEISFPFTFKEVGYAGAGNDNIGDYRYYVFLSSVNSIGIVKVYKDEKIDYNMITDESNLEKSLLYTNEQNKITNIGLENGYVVYYEEDHLIGSDGKDFFEFDDLPYQMQFVDYGYVGKGCEYCYIATAFNYDYNMVDELDIQQMVEETGISY